MMHTLQRPFRVGLFLIDGFALMSYSAVIEPLRAANQLSAGTDDGFSGALYEWLHIPALGQQAISSTGALIAGDAMIGDDLDLDLLLIVAGGDPFRFSDERTFAWLRKLAARGLTIGGVSGGPVILVKAGLMNARRMTVHWEHANGLMEMKANIALSRNLYVMDRDRLTCAGGVAPLDLMHAILAEHHGADFATKVSDWFLHTDIRPPGGPQKAGIIEKYGVNHPVLVQAIEAMENHVGDPLGLDDIADHVGCTPRHLNRLFKEALDASTMTFYRNLRLDHAMTLLRQTSLSITQIAYDVGFSSSAHFSRTFHGKFDISPKKARLSNSGISKAL